MKEASNDFNGPGKKPVGLRAGRVFKLIVMLMSSVSMGPTVAC